jgi:hypothetical protein
MQGERKAIGRIIELHKDVVDLRNRVGSEEGIALTDLSHDLDLLVGQIERLLAEVEGPRQSAKQVFQRVMELNRLFEVVTASWARVRAVAGTEAVEEILGKVGDRRLGWERRFGRYTDMALQRHGALVPGSNLFRRAARLDDVSILELRYGGNMPLAEIAELAGVSSGYVQGRTTQFELGVLDEVATAVVKEQLPLGWELAPDFDEAVDNPSLLCLHRQRRAPAADGLTRIWLYPLWIGRAVSAGRPRTAFKAGSVAGIREPRIYVVLFIDQPRVAFLPESPRDSRSDNEDRTRLESSVVDRLAEFGFDRLEEAVEQLCRDAAARSAQGKEGAS